jgi:hypothetical protein
MVSEPVMAKPRKLGARWTPELAQDIISHSIDITDEMIREIEEFIYGKKK